MRFIYSFVIFLLSLSAAYAQVENAVKKNSPIRANFYHDFLNFSTGNPDTTRLDIFIQVPYTEIQFIKTGEGFSASYTVTISIYDEDKEKLIQEKIWTEKLTATAFDQTISKTNFNLSLRNFYLPPGKYFIRTAVDDKESNKSYASENIYTIKDFSGKPSVSDIMLISKQTPSEKSNKILPNISRNISTQRDGIPLFFEVYTDSAQQMAFKYEILDNEENVLFSEDSIQQVDSGKTQVFHTFGNMELGLGNYLIKVTLDDEDELASTSTKSFTSRWIGIPSAIKDLDKAIDQMIYIASSSEIDKIEEADTQSEKVKLYMEYWKGKDPSPNTDENEIFDEYYRRVSYANETFSHYIEGWRTDRGMVFIILGAPNNVDRHPFDYDSKPYEVWEYYELNKSFVFVDETGFGDYRLITPLYGDFYRFR